MLDVTESFRNKIAKPHSSVTIAAYLRLDNIVINTFIKIEYGIAPLMNKFNGGYKES